ELRKAKGYSVPFLKEYFGFATTNAVYKWLRGETLPSLDNMFALSVLFGIPMNDIIVASEVLETNGVT
ncbi:helix-turn-helix transcriptional regulator, partial [Streptococcus pyogenes]